MNEQEFIRRMRNKGVNLNDQQLKGAYRQYVKDPGPFRDLVGESVKDPFFRGLEGTPEFNWQAALPGAKRAVELLPYKPDIVNGPKAATLPNIIDNTKNPKENIVWYAQPSGNGQAKIKQRYMLDDTIAPQQTVASSIQKALGGQPAGSSEYDAFMRSFSRSMGLDGPTAEAEKPGAAGGGGNPPDPVGGEAAAELAQLQKEWQDLMKNPNATRQDFIGAFNSKKQLKSLTDAAKDKKGQMAAWRMDPESKSFLSGLGAMTGLDIEGIQSLKKLGFSENNGFEDVLNNALRQFDDTSYFGDRTGTYSTALGKKVDSINDLKQMINDMKRHRATTEEIMPYQDQLDSLYKEFGTSVPGIKNGVLDKDKLVDIKLGNKPVGNARNSGGTTTGNMDDIVNGLGGKVSWNKDGTIANVYDADGKLVSRIETDGDKAVFRDANGKKTKEYSLDGGKVQADVAAMASALGVPLSYYHDKNGILHAYAQPEMRDAPVQVVRKEGQLYIDAYINFNIAEPKTYDAIKQYEQEDKVKKAYDAILKQWNNKEFVIDPISGEKIKLNTTIHGISSYGQKRGEDIPDGHKYVTINIDEDSKLKNDYNWTSHVFTVDPHDPATYFNAMNDVGQLFGGNPVGKIETLADKISTGDNRDVAGNLADAIKTVQLEKVLDNWTIKNPGQVWLYDAEKDAAHEFGHLLGLGDAYGANYRFFSEAPNTMVAKNDYGQDIQYDIPVESGTTYGDLMRGGKKPLYPTQM